MATSSLPTKAQDTIPSNLSRTSPICIFSLNKRHTVRPNHLSVWLLWRDPKWNSLLMEGASFFSSVASLACCFLRRCLLSSWRRSRCLLDLLLKKPLGNNDDRENGFEALSVSGTCSRG
uniref:Uncharacterized protein n=1 Tax=Craspedostauros australis TaxID=1486917 RepID=A0A7R9WR66_9STRA|mmetsp:Transcript_16344/g.45297  ORF Transcript_16344/g.45297 Transcript_16344/m.45297 type:complete len:119 (+) Transcript_16344:99-455(+)